MKPGPEPQNLPDGAVQVGNRIMYPDLKGDLHPTAGQAINSNQRVESDYSRGASGGCGQEASNVPPPDFSGGGY